MEVCEVTKLNGAIVDKVSLNNTAHDGNNNSEKSCSYDDNRPRNGTTRVSEDDLYIEGVTSPGDSILEMMNVLNGDESSELSRLEEGDCLPQQADSGRASSHTTDGTAGMLDTIPKERMAHYSDRLMTCNISCLHPQETETSLPNELSSSDNLLLADIASVLGADKDFNQMGKDNVGVLGSTVNTPKSLCTTQSNRDITNGNCGVLATTKVHTGGKAKEEVTGRSGVQNGKHPQGLPKQTLETSRASITAIPTPVREFVDMVERTEQMSLEDDTPASRDQREDMWNKQKDLTHGLRKSVVPMDQKTIQECQLSKLHEGTEVKTDHPTPMPHELGVHDENQHHLSSQNLDHDPMSCSSLHNVDVDKDEDDNKFGEDGLYYDDEADDEDDDVCVDGDGEMEDTIRLELCEDSSFMDSMQSHLISKGPPGSGKRGRPKRNPITRPAQPPRLRPKLPSSCSALQQGAFPIPITLQHTGPNECAIVFNPPPLATHTVPSQSTQSILQAKHQIGPLGHRSISHGATFVQSGTAISPSVTCSKQQVSPSQSNIPNFVYEDKGFSPAPAQGLPREVRRNHQAISPVLSVLSSSHTPSPYDEPDKGKSPATASRRTSSSQARSRNSKSTGSPTMGSPHPVVQNGNWLSPSQSPDSKIGLSICPEGPGRSTLSGSPRFAPYGNQQHSEQFFYGQKPTGATPRATQGGFPVRMPCFATPSQHDTNELTDIPVRPPPDSLQLSEGMGLFSGVPFGQDYTCPASTRPTNHNVGSSVISHNAHFLQTNHVEKRKVIHDTNCPIPYEATINLNQDTCTNIGNGLTNVGQWVYQHDFGEDPPISFVKETLRAEQDLRGNEDPPFDSQNGEQNFTVNTYDYLNSQDLESLEKKKDGDTSLDDYVKAGQRDSLANSPNIDPNICDQTSTSHTTVPNQRGVTLPLHVVEDLLKLLNAEPIQSQPLGNPHHERHPHFGAEYMNSKPDNFLDQPQSANVKEKLTALLFQYQQNELSRHSNKRPAPRDSSLTIPHTESQTQIQCPDPNKLSMHGPQGQHQLGSPSGTSKSPHMYQTGHGYHTHHLDNTVHISKSEMHPPKQPPIISTHPNSDVDMIDSFLPTRKASMPSNLMNQNVVSSTPNYEVFCPEGHQATHGIQQPHLSVHSPPQKHLGVSQQQSSGFLHMVASSLGMGSDVSMQSLEKMTSAPVENSINEAGLDSSQRWVEEQQGQCPKGQLQHKVQNFTNNKAGADSYAIMSPPSPLTRENMKAFEEYQALQAKSSHFTNNQNHRQKNQSHGPDERSSDILTFVQGTGSYQRNDSKSRATNIANLNSPSGMSCTLSDRTESPLHNSAMANIPNRIQTNSHRSGSPASCGGSNRGGYKAHDNILNTGQMVVENRSRYGQISGPSLSQTDRHRKVEHWLQGDLPQNRLQHQQQNYNEIQQRRQADETIGSQTVSGHPQTRQQCPDFYQGSSNFLPSSHQQPFQHRQPLHVPSQTNNFLYQNEQHPPKQLRDRNALTNQVNPLTSPIQQTGQTPMSQVSQYGRSTGNIDQPMGVPTEDDSQLLSSEDLISCLDFQDDFLIPRGPSDSSADKSSKREPPQERRTSAKGSTRGNRALPASHGSHNIDPNASGAKGVGMINNTRFRDSHVMPITIGDSTSSSSAGGQVRSFEADQDGETCLHLLSDLGMSAEQLSHLATNPGFRQVLNLKNTREETPLFVAVQNGSVSIVEFLLSQKADPNIICISQPKGSRSEPVLQTCLHEAVESGHVGLVMTLLSAQDLTDVNSKRPASGITPLMLALEVHGRSNCRKIVSLLKGHNASMLSQNNVSGVTPLMLAVQSGDVELVETLLKDAGPELSRSLVTQSDKKGCTCLHFAAALRIPPHLKQKLFRYIVLAGGDPSSRNEEGETPKDWDRVNMEEVVSKLSRK